MGLRQRIDSINTARKKRDALKKNEDKDMEDIRQRILAGESTGDKIKDFVIAVHGSIEEDAERPYRQLEQMLKGKGGEQVLVVNESIESYHRGGCFGGVGGTNVESDLRLGVLNSSDLALEIGDVDLEIPSILFSGNENKGPRLILPTKNYALRESRSKKWGLNEGEVIIPHYNFLDFDPKGEKTESNGFAFRSDMNANRSSRLLVMVGKKDVSKYFRSTRSLYKDDFSYVAALDLLGIKEQAPADFIVGYYKEVGEAKGHIISSLKKLTSEEKKLMDATDYSKFRGDRELMDEVAFRLNAPFDRLKDTTRSIESLLKSAVELDMHSEPLVLDGERPGETLNVPEYITTMCKRYKIPYSDE